MCACVLLCACVCKCVSVRVLAFMHDCIITLNRKSVCTCNRYAVCVRPFVCMRVGVFVSV